MGMFDSFYDANGDEWQTKAYGNALVNYDIGDEIPEGPPFTYQVRVLGDPEDGYGLATIRDGRLAEVPAERDLALPLLDYHGGWLRAGTDR